MKLTISESQAQEIASANESYGIGSKDVDKRVVEDYDIYKQLQHELHKNDDKWLVHSTPHDLCRKNNIILIESEEK